MKLKTLSLLLAAAYGAMAVSHVADAAGFEPGDRTYEQIIKAGDEKEIAKASQYVRQNPDADFARNVGSLDLNLNNGQPLDFKAALDKVALVRYPWFDIAYNEIMTRSPEKDSSTDKMDQQVSRELTSITGPRKQLANENINLLAPYMGKLFAHSALGDLDNQYDLPGSEEYKNVRNLWTKSTAVRQVGPLGVVSPIETGESAIFKDRFGRLRPNRLNNKSFPSGHTYEGFKYASTMALLFPERTRELMSNALQYGESRVIVKAHWPTDTIASRTTNLYNFASLLADEEIRPAIIEQARQAHAKLAESCGDTARNCLDRQDSPIADGYAANNDEIGYYGAHIDESEAAQKTVTADELPALSANLLRLRLPYVSEKDRLKILADTAYPADTLAGWMIEKGNPNTYWGVIDLPRATLGPVKLDEDMTINQRTGLDDDVADFGKYDSWTNNISGAGRLIKEGDGTLTLAGDNTFGGLDLNAGGIKLSGKNEFGGISTAQSGTLTIQSGSLKGGLEANDGALITGHGTVDSLTLNDGSVLKPRGLNEGESKSPVTMHVTSDLTINPGADYWVEVSPYGESTRIDVDGKTTIAGGSVSASMVGTDSLLADADTPSVLGNRYKIIASKGGVTGEFDKINTQPLTLMQASLVYKPKEVDLHFKRNSTPMSVFAGTGNQKGIADAMDKEQGATLSTPASEATRVVPIAELEPATADMAELTPAQTQQRPKDQPFGDKTYQEIFSSGDRPAITAASAYVREHPDSDFRPDFSKLDLNLNGGQPYIKLNDAYDKIKRVRNPWFDEMYLEVMNKAPADDSAAHQAEIPVTEKLTAITGPRMDLAKQDRDQSDEYLSHIFGASAVGNYNNIMDQSDHGVFQNLYTIWYRSIRVSPGVDEAGKELKESSESTIQKNRFARKRPNNSSSLSSFPSGHTYDGFSYASILSILYPERTEELMSRALQYGESRVMVKAHWATDTIASRTANYFNLAHILGDDEIRPKLLSEAKVLRNDFAKACGDTARNCLDSFANPVSDGFAADNDEIGYYGAYLPDAASVQETVSADELPPVSANLLRLRFPYLSNGQRLDILAQTAYPANTLAGWMIEKGQPNTYWGVIDLPKATRGPTELNGEVVVNQKSGQADDIADFGKVDTWRNDISGTGRLIKEGDGALNLAGRNSFGGFDLKEGEIGISGISKLTVDERPSSAENGKVTFRNGTLLGGLIAGKGAVITGEGYVDNLVLNNGAQLRPLSLAQTSRFAPNQRPGSFWVNSDLTFNKGSEYRVELTPGFASTMVNVGGKATINGGQVAASMVGRDELLSDADADLVQDHYNILHAGKGIDGQFDGLLTQPLTLMEGSISYTANDVGLNFKRNDKQIVSFAANANQTGLAEALDNHQPATARSVPTVAFYSLPENGINSTVGQQDVPQVQAFAAEDEFATSQSIADKIAQISREIANSSVARELAKPIEPITPPSFDDFGPDAVISQQGTSISAQGGSNGSATITRTVTVNGQTQQTVISSDPGQLTPTKQQNVSVLETNLGNGVAQKVTTITDPDLPGWSRTITTKTGPGISETSVNESISSTGGSLPKPDSSVAQNSNQSGASSNPVIADRNKPAAGSGQPAEPEAAKPAGYDHAPEIAADGSFKPAGRSYEEIFNTRDERLIAEASTYYREHPDSGFMRNDGSMNLIFNSGKPMNFKQAQQKMTLVRYPWFNETWGNVMNRSPMEGSGVDKIDHRLSKEMSAINGPRMDLAHANENQDTEYLTPLFAHSALGDHDKDFNLLNSEKFQDIRQFWIKSLMVSEGVDPETRQLTEDKKESSMFKERFDRIRPNEKNNRSFPSGHTFEGFRYAGPLSITFPERTREIVSNALQFGESRVMVKAHWPTDTIASRTVNYFQLAHLLADDEMRPALLDKAREVRADFAKACGDSVRNCLDSQDSPIADGYAADKDEIGYYGAHIPESEAVQSTVTADELPEISGNLLRLRFPYLDNETRRQILADTAYPANTLAGWMIEKGNPDSYWGVIDLPKATLGPVKLDKDLTVNQQSGLDDDIADFGKYDTWKSDIAGAGQLIKQGDGELTLAGNNSFGGFRLEGGDLALSGSNNFSKASTAQNGRIVLNNGTLNGGLIANHGAVLVGAGTVDSLVMNSGSQVRPQNYAADGSKPAELNVTNNVVFNAGSDYRVELTKDGQSTHIIVGGKATINGGTVSAGMVGTDALLSDADTSSVAGNSYHILSAQGGVQGQFDGLNTQPLTLMTGSLSYQPNGVDLSFKRNDTPMDQFVQGGNQSDVANQLDNSFGRPSGVVYPSDFRGLGTVATVTGGFEPGIGNDDVAGNNTGDFGGNAEVYSSGNWGNTYGGYYGNNWGGYFGSGYYGYPQVNPVYENIVRSARTPGEVTRALRQLSAAQSYADLASAQLQSSRYVRQAMRDRLARSLIPTPEQQVANGQGSLWVKPVFSWAHVSGNDEAESFDNDTQGFMLGGDVGNEFDGKVGVLFGYTHSRLDSSLDSKIKSDNIHLGLYGGKTFDNGLHISGGVAHTWHRNDAERHTSFGRINEDNNVKFNARSLQAYGEVAWKLGFDTPFYAEPFANVAYVHYKNKGFEEDGIAGYDVESKSYNTTLSTLGLRGAWQADLGLDEKLTISAEAGWQHNYGKRDYKADMAFKNSATKVGLQTVPINRDSAVLSAGVGYQLKGANVSVNYTGQVGGKYHDNTVSANLQWQF